METRNLDTEKSRSGGVMIEQNRIKTHPLRNFSGSNLRVSMRMGTRNIDPGKYRSGGRFGQQTSLNTKTATNFETGTFHGFKKR